MSLLHWWPLNKNGNDNGLTPFNQNISLVDDGKIGKCFNSLFNLTRENMLPMQPSHLKSITITMWVKGDSSKSYALATNAFEIRITPGGVNGFRLGNGGTNTYNAYATNGLVPINTWTHIGCVWDARDKKIRYYVNGTLAAESQQDLSNIGFNSISSANIPYQTGWFINDIRFYDEALSPTEIKEISKCCILHYDFEDPYLGLQNKSISNTSITHYTNGTISIDIDTITNIITFSPGTSTGYGPGGSILINVMKDGKWYGGSYTVLEGNINEVDMPFNFWLRKVDNSWTYPSMNNNIQYFTSVYNYGTAGIQINPNRTISKQIKVKYIIIEADSEEELNFKKQLYTTTNTINNVVYDCSGYSNNGTAYGNFSIRATNGLGQFSYKNKDNKYTTYIDCNIVPTFLTSATICLWYRKKTANESMLLCSGEYTGSHYSMAMRDTQPFWGYLGTTYVDGEPATSPPQDTEWHFYCNAGVNLSSWPAIQLGYHSDGYTYHGDCADFQIYNTTLTPEMIKQEYERKAAILYNNKLLTNSFVEISNVDTKNLVYNGMLELKNNTGFNGTYNATYKAIKWNYLDNTKDFIEINRNDTYRLSFDWLFISDPNSYCYFVIDSFDENKQFIQHQQAYHYKNTETTLVNTLRAGDTQVTLSSSANWDLNYDHRSYLGVYENSALGYVKATKTIRYTNISGNVLTLQTPWTGNTVPAGSIVANCYSGSGYCYPWYKQIASLTSGTWYHYEGNWTSNSIRPGTRYVKLGMIYNNGEHYVKNLRFENISNLQLNNSTIDNNITCINKSSTITTNNLKERGIKIRYIRDSLCGSTSNNSNHWIQIKAFNSANENIAFGKKCSGGHYLLTDEDTNDSKWSRSSVGGIADPNHSNYYYQEIDFGSVITIMKIQTWHYYSDGRSYNNILQVSADGIHWIDVFNSETMSKKQETPNGLEFILEPDAVKIFPTEIQSKEFIEK